METALRHELVKAIPELKNNIYPTNAPEGHKRPYLVYTRITTRKIKVLEGYTGKEALSYMFSIMAKRYEDMKNVTKQVETLLVSLPQREIGINKILIEDIEISNISEAFEFNLGVNRGIIDFTIFY